SAVVVLAIGCRRQEPISGTPAAKPLGRTAFTERIENYFEYEPLAPGRPSPFLMHLTDLSDGTPVEKAEVTLIVRGERQNAEAETKAKAGRVAGIYITDLAVPRTGRYSIEFRVKNAKLDERVVVDDIAAGDASPAPSGKTSGTVNFVMEQQ